ncbi:MAG TPA: NADP-dependent phosphogluconate dehydrogenase [Chitinophaga sp.]
MANRLFDFGMIGLGVMGRNLLLNMADHGFAVAGFDRDATKTQALETSATAGTTVKGTSSLEELVQGLARPRRIMMLVPAGQPVDDVIESLMPLLDEGDVIIDGGNSHYVDTLRRVKYVKSKGFHFMGMGVSGGEKGARFGPSIMPGGDVQAYNNVKPMLEAVSAKVNGSPCVDYMGHDAAGHYVKMVHNGIEYGIMQLISEAYSLLQHAGFSNAQLHDVFAKWNEGDMQSFLIEITRDIFVKKDDKTGKDLVDLISDKAGSKGTGKWTSQDAMDLPVPITVIDTAVALRNISAFKEDRVAVAKIFPGVEKINISNDELVDQVHDALYFATLISYIQGLAMLQAASAELKMEIPLQNVVRIWRGGCIIRSGLLETFYEAFLKNPTLGNLLLDETIADLIKSKLAKTRIIVGEAAKAGIPVAAISAALAYFDAYRTERLPTNLVQAQRDYFGAHTYQRIDIEGTFHTEWQ